jgi:hypothetical protein
MATPKLQLLRAETGCGSAPVMLLPELEDGQKFCARVQSANKAPYTINDT